MSRDESYLHHILDACGKIAEAVADGRVAFFAQYRTQDSVVRQLQIIGEATKHLSPDFCARYSDVPWKRIAGMRDVLIHNYMGVDWELVWEIAEGEIPTLESRVRVMLSESSDS